MTLPKNRGIDKDRMRIDKNIPNYLTILRIVAIPLIVMSFYFEDSKFAHRFGGIIFAAASLTDFFDGYLARRYDIVSIIISILNKKYDNEKLLDLFPQYFLLLFANLLS